jgi:DNA (cytosine-5)-methyltransferase 1
VQGLINLQNGVVLRQVQDQLESEGFEVQCFLIPASGIGAWHQRYRVWIVAHSQHNGLLAAESRCNEEKNRNERKDGEKNGSTGRSIGASPIRKTDNGYEDVSNTDTRLSIGENEKVQARRNTSTTSSEDVSNTDSSMRGRGRTIPLSRENKVWGFRVKEKRIGDNVRIETIGRNDILREDVPNTNGEGLQGLGLSTNMETKQGSIGSENSVEEQQTWWQTESNLCGVPNGISYELDKNRANRIKTLGNAIVPQIAREFGLAIKKVLSDEDII